MSLRTKIIFKSGAIMEVDCENVKVGKTKEGVLASIAFSGITKDSHRPLFMDTNEIVAIFVQEINE